MTARLSYFDGDLNSLGLDAPTLEDILATLDEGREEVSGYFPGEYGVIVQNGDSSMGFGPFVTIDEATDVAEDFLGDLVTDIMVTLPDGSAVEFDLSGPYFS